MMTQTELEARLLAVETALKAIQHRLAILSPTEHWLDAVIGSFKDEPAFDDVIALGRAFREAEPYPEARAARASRLSWIRTIPPCCRGLRGRPTPACKRVSRSIRRRSWPSRSSACMSR